MTETQQYPTREQIAEALYRRHHPYPAWVELGGDQERWLKDADAVLALFPQPTPSAEQLACPHWERGRITMRNACTACAAETASSSIADMAPGTTFTANLPSHRFVYQGEGTYRDEWTRAHVSAAAFDPFTIRDVTPPPAAAAD